MICESCGAQNKNDIKNCEVCGNSLSEHIKHSSIEKSKQQKCFKCGELNDDKNNYCRKCGNNLNQSMQYGIKKKTVKKENLFEAKYSAVKDQKNKKNSPIWIILQMKVFWISLSVLFGMLLIITIAEVFVPHNHDNIKQVTKEIKSNPIIEADVERIANKFVCNCGDCSRETLTICKCNYAISERNLIRELVEKKTKEDEIIKIVDAKFGGLKSPIKS